MLGKELAKFSAEWLGRPLARLNSGDLGSSVWERSEAWVAGVEHGIEALPAKAAWIGRLGFDLAPNPAPTMEGGRGADTGRSMLPWLDLLWAPRLCRGCLKGEREESAPAKLDGGTGGVWDAQGLSPQEVADFRRVRGIDLSLGDAGLGQAPGQGGGEATAKPLAVDQTIKAFAAAIVAGPEA